MHIADGGKLYRAEKFHKKWIKLKENTFSAKSLSRAISRLFDSGHYSYELLNAFKTTMIGEKIKEYDLDSIDDYLSSEMKELYSSQRQFKWSEKTQEIISLLETNIVISRSGKPVPLRTACKGYEKMIYMPKFESKVMAEILTEYPKALIFKVPDIDGTTLANMENVGILDGRTLYKLIKEEKK